VAARSKAEVCRRSSAEIVGSHPTGVMVVCRLWVLCEVRWRSLRRADLSSRGVLPNVVRHCVRSRNLVNEEALAHWGLSHQKTNILYYIILYIGNNLRSRTPCSLSRSDTLQHGTLKFRVRCGQMAAVTKEQTYQEAVITKHPILQYRD
jgi:hypothetical protein